MNVNNSINQIQETIYTLQLEGGKYYVGKSKNISNRILQHFSELGSSWTKSYKPIKVLSQIPSTDPFDEEKYTLLTMDKYGIDNVRGGSYCRLILSKHEMEKAQQIIYSICDKCYRCGEQKHTASECDDIKVSIVLKFLMDVKINGLCKEKSRKLITKSINYKSISCDIDGAHYSFKNFVELYKSINKIVLKEVDGIIAINNVVYWLDTKTIDFNEIIDSISELYSSLSLQFK
jgi:hypothetical protein